MKKITKSQQLHETLKRLKAKGKSIGFVPTMGALHEGHLSLVRSARKENDVVVVSIFVNKLQFGPKEDFKKYPRPIRKDLALLKKERVNFVFLPSEEEMYPEGGAVGLHFRQEEIASSSRYGGTPRNDAERGPSSSPSLRAKRSNLSFSFLTRHLCAKFRPGHFEGVAAVVAKLFNIVRPDRAYFGAKDYQQVKVIEQLNRDLNLAIQIRVLPTVREKDGLAMSSRNFYLTPEERRRARVISQTLFWVRDQIRGGNRGRGGVTPPLLASAARRKLSKIVDKVQYFEIVDPETLEPLVKTRPRMVAAAACFVGKTRLIDNVIIRVRG